MAKKNGKKNVGVDEDILINRLKRNVDVCLKTEQILNKFIEKMDGVLSGAEEMADDERGLYSVDLVRNSEKYLENLHRMKNEFTKIQRSRLAEVGRERENKVKRPEE